MSRMYEDIYAFDTLQEAIDFFEVEGVPFNEVLIEGPCEDTPIFLWEKP